MGQTSKVWRKLVILAFRLTFAPCVEALLILIVSLWVWLWVELITNICNSHIKELCWIFFKHIEYSLCLNHVLKFSFTMTVQMFYLDAGTVGMTFQVEKLRYYFSSQMSLDSFFPEIEISWKKCKSLKWLFESSSAMYI